MFDPHTSRWTLCCSMNKPRENLAVATCNGFIYAVSGFDRNRSNKSIVFHDDAERFDLRTNQWTILTSLNRPKICLAMVAIHAKLYILARFDGKPFEQMESFDTETEQWVKVKLFSSIFFDSIRTEQAEKWDHSHLEHFTLKTREQFVFRTKVRFDQFQTLFHDTHRPSHDKVKNTQHLIERILKHPRSNIPTPCVS